MNPALSVSVIIAPVVGDNIPPGAIQIRVVSQWVYGDGQIEECEQKDATLLALKRATEAVEKNISMQPDHSIVRPPAGLDGNALRGH